MTVESDKSHISWRAKALVWILRICIGAVFVISGFAKADDIYGFIFKIEEYLDVWNLSYPRSLIFVGATTLSVMEFLLGLMLMLGCYRRTVVWLLLLMMVAMTPLTAYIYFVDPVPDCGCFGDFIVLSNGATFLKNILITIGLVYLLLKNRMVDGLFGAYIQWLVTAISTAYILTIGMIGYFMQPLIDFRSFPVGSTLLTEENDSEESDFEFIYEKNGEKKAFSVTELPDSSWTFVERKQIGQVAKDKTELVIFNEGENITSEVLASQGDQLLILIPEYSRADVSNTYLLNLLDNYIKSQGGSMMTLVTADAQDIEEWKDLSMADYPVYYAEPTTLKEMARGIMPAVYLKDGRIVWKRTLPSIDSDKFEQAEDTPGLMDSLAFDGPRYAKYLTFALFVILMMIFMLDRSGRLLAWSIKIRKKAQSLK
ncbi:MAG: DoxX family membrane protein [Bacteroides sp.]|nr:DoxX family membrane protein [Bacteroides sp.]